MKFKEYEMPDGKKAVFEYDENGVGKITLECMDMLMGLINDRKTENSSEKPNNCDACRNKGFEGCEQPCLGCGCCGLYEPKDEPQTHEIRTNTHECVKDTHDKDEPTSSKMEQVDKDINVRSKDEPQTCDNCKLKGTTKWRNNKEVCRAYKPKDEPQTEREGE